MVLLKVEYEFFEFDDPSSSVSELDRQVRLTFNDSSTLYVSWTWERYLDPTCEAYSISYGPVSYFVDGAAAVVDASKAPLWSRHIGQEIALRYTPTSDSELEYQVLEVRSPTSCTYLYSLGRDRISLSDKSPIQA